MPPVAVSKCLDAILTAPLRPRQSFLRQLREVLRGQSSNYDRIASAANLLDKIIPGFTKLTACFLCRPGQLPLAASSIELFAFGSGSTVFRLETPAGPKVLKIYRRTLGVHGDRLVKLVDEFKRKYERVRSWHNGPSSPVHPASFLAVDSPVLGRPAAACLQSYIPGDKKDLFLHFTDDELLHLAQANDSFRAQVTRFAQKTIAVYSRDGLCVDILGENNLMVCWIRGQPRLTLIDYGVFDLGLLGQKRPGTCRRIVQRIERLAGMNELLSPVRTSQPKGQLR